MKSCLCRCAGPLLLVLISRFLTLSAMALYAASLGTTALAAYQVLINLYTLFGLFGEPLSQAAQAMLPPLLEQKDRRGVRRAVKMLGGKNSPPQSLSTPAAFGKNKS